MTPGYLFTSESVTEGHPDKVADQISDAVLDAVIEQDPYSRVACETFVTTGLVVIGGEITTAGYVDVQRVARDTIKSIGYTDAGFGPGLGVLRRGRIPRSAVGRHSHGRGPAGCGRPGHDVRLRDRRDPRDDAPAHHPGPQTDQEPCRDPEERRRAYLRPDGKSQSRWNTRMAGRGG